MEKLERQENAAVEIINFRHDHIDQVPLSQGQIQAFVESFRGLWDRFSRKHHKLSKRNDLFGEP